jgi:ABC-type xylose transport system substrate-binding protein
MAETSIRTSHLLLQILTLRWDRHKASQIAEQTAGDEETIVCAASVEAFDMTSAGRLSALAAALSRVEGAPTRALSHFDV